MKKSKMLWYFTIIFIVFNLLIFITNWGGDNFLMYITDLLPIICSLITVICLIAAFKSFTNFDFPKKAWLLILLGTTLYCLAEIIYAILELGIGKDMDETFPSLADVFWCLGYIPLFWGLGMMFLGYKRSGFPLGNIKLYILLAAVLLVISGIVFIYVLLPILQDPETKGITKVFSMFYPVADVIIVIPAITLMYITSLFGASKISWPWRLLALGFIAFTIADLIYSVLVWQGTYNTGNYIDLGWNLGYLLIAIAGMYQKELVESVNGRIGS